MKTLEDMGPAKLHDLERARLRSAADTLLFASPHDPAAFDAVADVEHLARHLIETGRWLADRATALTDDVAGCGPELVDGLVVAEPARAAA
jgi:hypothetical protein